MKRDYLKHLGFTTQTICMSNRKACPEFPHFGARYPDARCIDGYLWDLDSDENGGLTHGGDDPCPFCNTEAYIEFRIGEDGENPTRAEIEKHIAALRLRYEYPG